MASTIPAALSNLLAALQAAGLPAVDGPEVGVDSDTETVAVGYTDAEDDTTAVDAATAIEGGTVTPLREQYTIRCAVMTYDGDPDQLPALRVRAYGLLDQVAAVLAADTTLGGAVMLSWISGHTLLQEQGSGGATAVIRFGVECDANTTGG